MEVPTMHYAPKKVIQQYWDIDKRKSRPQALAKQKYALGETSGKVTSLHPKTSARPQPASPAAAGAPPGCSWRWACPGDSCRGALRALQELGGAGPPPGVSGWHRWCGAPGQDPPASTMWKGKKGGQRHATALSLDWWKRCQVQLYHVNAHIIQNLKNQTQSSTSWHFNIIWYNLDVRHRRSNLPFANKLQPQGASVLWFFCKNALTASDISDWNLQRGICSLQTSFAKLWHVHVLARPYMTWFEMIWNDLRKIDMFMHYRTST